MGLEKFEKFGTVSFTKEAKAADFISHLEQGKIMATKCQSCGRVYFPPRVDCADCLDSKVDWLEITGNGKLVTYTIVNYGPSGFENETPYTLALAEFPGGVKIFGRLDKAIPQGDIKAGMSVKLAPVKLAEEKVAYIMQKA
jgi:uncharacterized OB-fold protein